MFWVFLVVISSPVFNHFSLPFTVQVVSNIFTHIKKCVTRIVTHFWRFFHTRLNGFLRETEKRWKSFLFGAIKTGLNFLHRAQISRTRGINVWTRKIFFFRGSLWDFCQGGSLKSGKWRQNRQWFRKKIRESKFFCFLPLLLIGKVS